MTKLKRWLIEQYLPAWCRSELLAENERLTAQVDKRDREIERLNAYIDGVEDGLRNQRKIIINTQGGNAQ